MKFMLDAAFALELLAIAAGLAMLIWSMRNQGAGNAIAKFGGYAITIVAVIALLCTGWHGYNYWNQGAFKAPKQLNMKLWSQQQQQARRYAAKHFTRIPPRTNQHARTQPRALAEITTQSRTTDQARARTRAINEPRPQARATQQARAPARITPRANNTASTAPAKPQQHAKMPSSSRQHS